MLLDLLALQPGLMCNLACNLQTVGVGERGLGVDGKFPAEVPREVPGDAAVYAGATLTHSRGRDWICVR